MKSKKPARIAQKLRSPRSPIPRLTPEERRKRQLRGAAKRYRERQRKRRTRGLAIRTRRPKPDRWTLPPEAPPYHDAQFCTPSHHPGCPYFERPAFDGQLADDEDPDALKVSFPRRRRARPV